jgi:hypothetical protein
MTTRESYYFCRFWAAVTGCGQYFVQNIADPLGYWMRYDNLYLFHHYYREEEL